MLSAIISCLTAPVTALVSWAMTTYSLMCNIIFCLAAPATALVPWVIMIYSLMCNIIGLVIIGWILMCCARATIKLMKIMFFLTIIAAASLFVVSLGGVTLAVPAVLFVMILSDSGSAPHTKYIY